MINKAYQFHMNLQHRIVDVIIALVLIVMLTPIWIINTILSLLSGNSIYAHRVLHDAIDRVIKVSVFNRGLFRESLVLIAVLRGKIQFCGVSTKYSLDDQYHNYFLNTPPGIFSLFDLYQWIGLVDKSHHEVLAAQVCVQSTGGYFFNLVKLFITYFFYAGTQLRVSKTFTLFGVKINNMDLPEFLNWITTDSLSNSCRTGFFVNVNSLNIAMENADFKSTLLEANRVFADGSGVRLAAAHTGEKLIANLNGTDLLPHICRSLIEKNKSIFLLGAQPGIAKLAAENLQRKYVGLKIAGSHHGYFKNSENEKVIDDINNSGADICLVAMGSPLQETWLVDNADQLNCSTALAVGGLFDFYSGEIPRAPRWLRELGFEWVWRLIQEPSGKFNRYVIGNPTFLIRTFILNQARG